MRKLWKSGLALFLAGVMALTPAGESVAATLSTVTGPNVVVVEETVEDSTVEESITEENEIETVVETETTVETETEAETETTVETETEAETETTVETETEAETETTVETETEVETETTVETETEAETETTVETEIETETEVETETELETETEVETETEEDTILPGLKNYVLSAEEKAERNELADYLSTIKDLKEGTDYVAGELVFLADTREEAEKIATAYGGELARFNEGIAVIALPENVSVVDAVTVAATADSVAVPPAWPNYIYKTCTETEVDNTNVEVTTEGTVSDDVYTDEEVYSEAVLGYNDPYLSATSNYYQWQHAMVGSVTAWNAGYNGNGIKIAVLDTGVTKQTDLNVIAQYDMTGEGVGDGNAHGTHVAGLAAAKANNKTYGAGIAPGASIIDVKVLNSEGSGYGDWIMSGINKAVAADADIINMSLGGYFYSKPYADVVKNAYEKGVAVFAAAGNDGSKAKDYPAAFPGAIAVGAVQQSKGRTYFSNYGSWVKFSAPGYELPSLPNKGSDPVIMSGTSQATPVVSGTAAVILSADATIRNKTGKARVDALVAKMNKGKIAGNGGAAGIVSLPKALGIPVSTAAPGVPTFSVKSGTKIKATSTKITIKSKSSADTIYYSTNGKAPTYKNGVLNNATKYTGAITITGDEATGKSKVTVQAIAVNSCGKVSKVAKATYTFEPLVNKITIEGQNVLIKEKSTTLKATVTPSYAKNKKVTWTSSAPTEVKVDKNNGKVTATNKAVADKEYTITATAKDGSNKTATFKIKVKAAATVKKVSFTKTKDTVTRSSDVTYNVGALLKVENQDKTTGKVTDVTWTSNNTKVATVNANGVVTAKLPGKATIKATAKDGSGKSASFTLTVKQYVTDMSITALSNKLSNGKSTKLTLTFNGGDKTKAPSNKGVTWSISPSAKDTGVKVDNNGKVTAGAKAKAGTYTVTATAKDGSKKTASIKITVSDNAISKIKLDKTSAKVFRIAGNDKAPTSVTINATITSKSKADASAVQFTSSNPGVATVTQNGTKATIKATGKVAGTTVITCQALDGSGKKATCKVTVVNPASNLTVTPPGGNEGYVGAGKKIKMAAVIEEDFGAVSSKSVTWSTSDKSVATVDKNGNVKGVKVGGVATITAKLNDGSNMSASYKVYVMTAIKKLAVAVEDDNGNVVGMNPSREGIAVRLGGSSAWYLLYNGKWAGSTNNVFPLVAVEVANPDIVTASWHPYYPDGFVLYGNKRGKTKITLKALDGSNTKVTYEIKVY